MISRITKRFRSSLSKLPKATRRKAQESYRLFIEDHRHPSLRFKRIHSTEQIYSVRISLDYRAVGIVEDDTIVWFWIGSHAQYDKLLDQL